VGDKADRFVAAINECQRDKERVSTQRFLTFNNTRELYHELRVLAALDNNLDIYQIF